jgi:hypothetical protein
MFLAFGVCFPFGIIAVRFLRNVTRHYVWLHIAIQALGFILATIGVILAYARFPSDSINLMHSRIGAAVVALVWLQPIPALFRPKKGSPVRPFWFVVHWLCGVGVIVLGWVNIFFGIDIYKAIFGTKANNIYILYSVWISVVGIAYLFLDRLPYIRDQARVESSELKPARATAFPSVTDEKNVSRGVPAGSVV